MYFYKSNICVECQCWCTTLGSLSDSVDSYNWSNCEIQVKTQNHYISIIKGLHVCLRKSQNI